MKTALYNGYKVNLVESLEDLSVVKSFCTPNVKVGCDTETEGLDYTLHSVVGICIACGKSYSQDDYQGFYIPVRHHNYPNNLPLKTVIAFLQWVVDNFSTVWWNRPFDFSMLEKDGFVCPFVGKTHDAQCMAHLIQGESFPALKDFTKRLLKFDVLEYSSNKADEGNFATTDPTTSYIYAAQDPLITALLARKIWAEYPYIRKIYPLDNKVGEAMRCFMREALIYLDRDLLQSALEKNQSELSSIKKEIFALTGYEFKLNSNRDKADALTRFVTLTKKTASGNFVVSEEVLSEIDHPLAKLLTQYAHLEKYRSSYLEKMLKFPNPFRAAYQLCNVPTGRFSSGTSRGNSYFSPLNIQNVKKAEVYKYIIPDEVLGWRLSLSPEGAVGKMKCKGGLRDVFVCPEGWVWFSSDFASQELKLAANFSQEPGLLEPISRGEDIHKYVATKMFDHYDPSHRTVAKTINFAALYGAGGYTIGQRLGVSSEEGEGFLRRYNEALPLLARWKEEMVKDARRKGFVFTYFGRPRALFPFFNGDAKQRSLGDRSAVNSVVQGTGGDLCRLLHVKLWDRILKDPEFRENTRYILTVHDEVNFFVKPHYLKTAAQIILDAMYFKPSNFKVAIDASPSVGYSWGTQIEYDDITPDGKIVLNAYKDQPLELLQQKFREENPELFQ